MRLLTLEMEKLGTEVRAAMESPNTTISSASQAITETSEPAEAAEIIRQLEEELWEKEKCAKRFMDEMTSQIMELKNIIQEKNKIISELRKKLNGHEYNEIEDGLKNANRVTNWSLTRTVGVDSSRFDFLRILGIGGFGRVFLAQKKGGADDGRFYAMKVIKKTAIIKNNSSKYVMAERRVLEAVRHHPFLTTLHYAFQSDSKLYLALEFRGFGESNCQNFFFIMLVYMPLKYNKIFSCIHCLLCLWQPLRLDVFL